MACSMLQDDENAQLPAAMSSGSLRLNYPRDQLRHSAVTVSIQYYSLSMFKPDNEHRSL